MNKQVLLLVPRCDRTFGCGKRTPQRWSRSHRNSRPAINKVLGWVKQSCGSRSRIIGGRIRTPFVRFFWLHKTTLFPMGVLLLIQSGSRQGCGRQINNLIARNFLFLFLIQGFNADCSQVVNRVVDPVMRISLFCLRTWSISISLLLSRVLLSIKVVKNCGELIRRLYIYLGYLKVKVNFSGEGYLLLLEDQWRISYPLLLYGEGNFIGQS